MRKRGHIGLYLLLLGACLSAFGGCCRIAGDVGRDYQRKIEVARNEVRREAILRGVATYTVDISGNATFTWLVPIKAER